jgi:broad specificity phosphatase PhoE
VIVLVRHGPTEWSVSGRHTGKTDLPLTEDGRAAAASLRERLAGYEFTTVLTSPLLRARETAELAGLGDRAEPEADLREYDYGDYEGLTTDQIREDRPGWYLWRDGVPNGETPDEVAARCDRVIEEILTGEGDVAIVAHGHILRALGARWLDATIDVGGRLALGTGSISVLGWEREVSVLRSWNA